MGARAKQIVYKGQTSCTISESPTNTFNTDRQHDFRSQCDAHHSFNIATHPESTNYYVLQSLETFMRCNYVLVRHL